MFSIAKWIIVFYAKLRLLLRNTDPKSQPGDDAGISTGERGKIHRRNAKLQLTFMTIKNEVISGEQRFADYGPQTADCGHPQPQLSAKIKSTEIAAVIYFNSTEHGRKNSALRSPILVRLFGASPAGSFGQFQELSERLEWMEVAGLL